MWGSFYQNFPGKEKILNEATVLRFASFDIYWHLMSPKRANLLGEVL